MANPPLMFRTTAGLLTNTPFVAGIADLNEMADNFGITLRYIADGRVVDADDANCTVYATRV